MKIWFINGTFRKVVAQTTMLDVAIGLALAGVFVKLVNAFVTNILTPPIGALIGGKSVANFELALTFLPGKEPVLFRYGVFIDALVEFLLVAFVVYWAARAVLRIKKSGTEAIARTKKCTSCCMKIPSGAKVCPFCQREL